MVNAVSEQEWKLFLESQPSGLFADPLLHQAIAAATGTQNKYFLYNKKGKNILGLQACEHGNVLCSPMHYAYAPLLFDAELSENSRIEALTALIQFLKNAYTSIELRFSPDLKDMRAFQWEGFSLQARYTYIKDTSSLDYHKSVQKNLRKSTEEGIAYSVNEHISEGMATNASTLRAIGNAYPEKTIAFCQALQSAGLLYSFEATDAQSGNLLASNLVLAGNNHQQAYLMLLNVQPGLAGKENVHTGLYDFIFRECAARGITNVDLGGANIKAIAAFKSYFFPELQSYFEVAYRKRNALQLILAKVAAKLS